LSPPQKKETIDRKEVLRKAAFEFGKFGNSQKKGSDFKGEVNGQKLQ
jgi:hypothetical protein